MSCLFFNVIYVLICSVCLEEYIGEMGEGKTRLRDIQTTHKTTRAGKLEVEEHIRNCGRGSFKIFPFLQMRPNDTNLIRAYETKFQREYKTKPSQL